MTDRPIRFNDEMVRAILDGRKTQTRRVVNWKQLHKKAGLPYPTQCRLARFSIADDWALDAGDDCMRVVGCPYGAPGDTLWGRETFAIGRCLCCDDGHSEVECTCMDPPKYRATWPSSLPPYPGKWRHSIHMPRWASRITLEVVSVRVERVADISLADIRSEGVACSDCWTSETSYRFGAPPEHCGCRNKFSNLWNDIYAKRGFDWDKNPYVWVVEFKRV